MNYKIHKFLILIGLIGIMMVSVIGCGKKEENATTQTEITSEDGNATEQIDEIGSSEANSSKAIANTGDYTFTLASNNSWESGDMVYIQYDCIIKNHSDVNGSDWKITIDVPQGSKLDNGWNGEYEISGDKLIITPVDYNKEVVSGAEIPIGFILATPESFSADKAVLEIGGNQYALGENESPTAKTENTEVTNDAKDTTTEPVDKETSDKKVATKDISGTPVANHGALSVEGTNIVDKNGDIFQLQGVSTHGINWFPEYVNKEAFSDLSKYGVNAIRLAMYTVDYNGYCEGGSQANLEATIDKGVQACTELGMYVIIDWHILNDKDPNVHKDSAIQFFEKMSKKYADYDNVLYEICNEPNGGTTWESVKSYAEEVIPVIRTNDKDALIIVGTPNWSQDVDVASNNPIQGQKNIVYAVHFYAATHQGNIRSKVETAIGNGLPVIVSESNISEASGNGALNYDEGEKWMDLIDRYHLSCFAWSLGNKDETSSFLKANVSKTSGFSEGDFSDSGKWYLEHYSK
ncbi:MAG: cellulase family glycosylhydrolase [Lachnospiraceae bacterium]|nr:cellulase family glycosylhydrolase [Lachnospiraceae bacterium]